MGLLHVCLVITELTQVILLDKIQKNQPVNDEAAQMLKKQGLIEGRKPNYYVAAQIAESTGVKADYIKHRSFNDQYFKDMIIEYLKKFKKASKKDIDDLLFNKLPDVLNGKQKENKIRNLIYALSKKEELIINEGTRRKPVWKLKKLF